MGSAEVFFRKPRAEKEILNDYNGDLVNLFRVIQNNEKLAYLLGRLYLSINGELAFKQNKDRLKGVPNILDDVIETSQIFYDASWEDIQNAAAFLENQVYSFSSTGQTFGIARRDMSQRLPRLMSAYNRIRDAIILHRDYKDVITYAACPGSFILLDPPYKGTEDMYSKANFDISASVSGRPRNSARPPRNGSAAWSASSAGRPRACKTAICTTTPLPTTTAKIL